MNTRYSLLMALVASAGMISCAEVSDDQNTPDVPAQICEENAVRCNTQGIPEKCTSNAWVAQTACSTGYTCSNGYCYASGNTQPTTPTTDSCVDGTMKCSAAGIPQKCVSSTWVDQAACTEGKKCMGGLCNSDGSQTAACTDGAKQCSASGVPQSCVAGTWVDLGACSSNQKCENGGCVAAGVCTDGAKQCSAAGVPQSCVAGTWVDLSACSANQKCENGSCVAAGGCTDGAKQCSAAGVPQMCAAGTWVDLGSCGANQTCDKGDCVAASGVCTDGTKQCSAAGVPQTCAAGTWVDLGACGANQTCDKGDCVAAATTCTGGDRRCSDAGVPQMCLLGDWVDQAACASGQKCDAGSCVENSDGKCKSNSDCKDSLCNTSTGACVACLSSTDCKDNVDGTTCNTSTGTCGCTSNSQCVTGMTCDQTKKRCEAEACTASACKAASGDSYKGNVCVDGTDGKTCGCEINSDCNSGYTCHQGTQTCTKPADFCVGFENDNACVVENGEDYLTTCINGVESTLPRQKCSSTSSGNICVVDDLGYAFCGCKSNSDCNTGYECSKDNICKEKAACSASACAAMTGDSYKGNACVSDACGCKSNSDCNTGYECKSSVCSKKSGATSTTHTETFSDHDADASKTAGTYTKLEYVSTSTGVTWTSEGAQWEHNVSGTDYSIDKGGIRLKASNSLEGTVTSGATGVSAKVAEGSSSSKTKTVEIYLNNTKCGSVDVKGTWNNNTKTNTALTLNCDASVAGSTKITLKAPSYPIIIDDITWTDYSK